MAPKLTPMAVAVMDARLATKGTLVSLKRESENVRLKRAVQDAKSERMIAYAQFEQSGETVECDPYNEAAAGPAYYAYRRADRAYNDISDARHDRARLMCADKERDVYSLLEAIREGR